jgi:non-ribosomal peptide synthetase-like protein
MTASDDSLMAEQAPRPIGSEAWEDMASQGAEFLRDEVLADIFDATVTTRGPQAAIMCGNRTWSYAQVSAEADVIARGLIREGIGPGDFVGLWFERGPELLISQLAITKAGAAWVPFDSNTPIERVATCMTDCSGKGLLTSGSLQNKAARAGLVAWTPSDLTAVDNNNLTPARAASLTNDHAAYLIYTSGSTGIPKGTIVTHRNVCHFLRAANSIYKIGPNDVMLQAASVGFDLSVEEIWIPYLVGAKLCIATADILADTENLPGFIADHGITVLDTVPTLASMIPKDVPTVRLIIFGGEVLPDSLLQRWSRRDRQIFNTYGPTETTIVATVAEQSVEQPITIGRPLPNYTCYVVDQDLKQVRPGELGELLIGGPGVAAGYLNRDVLTAEKFIRNPFRPNAEGPGVDPVLFRSGDLVTLDAFGNLIFLSRIDDQVKIRGFRVEPAEVEAQLQEISGVCHAAVIVRQDHGNQLVAFLTAEPGATVAKIRSDLSAILPSYMVPTRFEFLPELPLLASGKVDRPALRIRPFPSEAEPDWQEFPQSVTEATLLAAARKIFDGRPLSVNADFFTELGGHSLLAARFLSAVRKDSHLKGLNLADIYEARTIRSMAERIDSKASQNNTSEGTYLPPPRSRRFICGLAQLLALPLILSMVTAPWLGVFAFYWIIAGQKTPILFELLLLGMIYVAINVSTIGIVIGSKWLILGRTKPGAYPLWGVYYFRWWLVQRLTACVSGQWVQGTPLMRTYLRAMGATIKTGAIIGDIHSGALDLLTIGCDSSIGNKVRFANAEVIGNKLVIGTTEIGADVCIGTACVLGRDVVLGAGAELAELTYIAAGSRIPSWEKWEGSPAKKVDRTAPGKTLSPQPCKALQWLQIAYYLVLFLLIPPSVFVVPILIGLYFLDLLQELLTPTLSAQYASFYFAVFAWPAAMVTIAVSATLTAALRWCVLPRPRPGEYSIYSTIYLRKWLVGLASDVARDILSGLRASLYMPWLYRFMGAAVGKSAEIADFNEHYYLLEIGERCFLSDQVSLGDEDVRRRWVSLQPTKLGTRVFVGNDAVVRPGIAIPAEVLIGVKCKAPDSDKMKAGGTWFGSPPIRFPTRERIQFGETFNFEPSRRRRFARGVFEAFSASLPLALFIIFGTIASYMLAGSLIRGDSGEFASMFMGASVSISLGLTLAVLILKWTVIGHYRPSMHPMWSWWAIRAEAISTLYWGLACPILLEHLHGTPFLPWVLNLFGCHFGKGVFLDTTEFTEFDCIEVGDFVSMNSDASLQTHLYEDRVMKLGRIKIGNRVTIGAESIVLYGACLDDAARIRPLTVVMKGEYIPPNTEWVGAPAVSHGISSANV